MTELSESDSLFEFPCEFPIKIMGLAEQQFELLVTDIIRQQGIEFSADAVQIRPSRNGKYVAVTVTFTAHCRAQLDDLYTKLSQHERVMMVL